MELVQVNRVVKRNFATAEECANLIRVHDGCCSVGYMPDITITTLRELWNSGCTQHFIPIISLRDKVRDFIEEKFDCFGELYYEWTSINCWNKGSYINPHHDSNRDYLKQRHFSALVYLNSKTNSQQEQVGFKGGDFHFVQKNSQGIESSTVVTPESGLLLAFSSGSENIHYVTEVKEGVRYALTLWFTKDSKYSSSELKYFLPGRILGSLPSLWETNAQKWSLRRQLLEKAGISCNLDGLLEGTSERKSEKFKLCPGRIRTVMNIGPMKQPLVQLHIMLTNENINRLMQFAAFVMFSRRISIGELIQTIVGKSENKPVFSIQQTVLDSLDNMYHEWYHIEQKACNALTSYVKLWLTLSDELVGGVDRVETEAEACRTCSKAQLFRRTFEPELLVIR
mmetsp:Transcript_15197/g.19951  ORF Transcript_15197/g.19951 Transcript_15197/m.19951 type:complete len:397 (+) Transcript_15197:78-1268(+)